MDSPSGTQEMTIINESGLYSLTLSSKLPTAKKFKHWITKEVLPSIRKTGSYNVNLMSDKELMAKALLVAHKTLEEKEEKIKLLTAKNEELEPKGTYYDNLVDHGLDSNFRDTAKELGLGQKQFIDLLIDNKYIYRDKYKKIRPYGGYVKGENNPGTGFFTKMWRKAPAFRHGDISRTIQETSMRPGIS